MQSHSVALVIVISDNAMSKVRPLSTSAKVTLSDEHSTQDSIINDSGFLPSTPPSKKVCYNVTTVTLSYLCLVNSSREAQFCLKWIRLEIDKAVQKFLPQTQRKTVTSLGASSCQSILILNLSLSAKI